MKAKMGSVETFNSKSEQNNVPSNNFTFLNTSVFRKVISVTNQGHKSRAITDKEIYYCAA